MSSDGGATSPDHGARLGSSRGEAARPPRVLVVGDVIDDLVVTPSRPIARGTDTPARIVPTAGGAAANQAAWLARAGAEVRFAGRVGAADADRHASLLQAAGVEPWLAADPERPTGTIVVLIEPDGERTMLTDRGANLRLTAADLPDRLLDGADAVHLTGYSFFDPPVRSAALDLVARARARGLVVSVDPGSSGFLADVGAEAFLGWVDGADLLLPNLDEARTLTGCVEAAEAIAVLLRHAALAVVTCGADGATVGARGSAPVAVPAVPAEVVDTTGAGDAFTGTFLAAWLAGGDPVRAAHLGAAAGALAVTTPGGRPPGS